jgi:hypothetical protein
MELVAMQETTASVKLAVVVWIMNEAHVAKEDVIRGYL